jgi:hypothetical protein
LLLALLALPVASQVDRGYYGGPGYYESSYEPAYNDCRIERQAVEDR